MKASHTKLGLIVLFVLTLLVILSHFSSSSSQTFSFDFAKNLGIKVQSNALEEIVENNLKDQEGEFAVYIHSLVDDEGFALNETQIFPAASLYKLIVMAAVMKEVEGGSLTLTTPVSATKTYLTKVLGSVDYGYEDSPEYLEYTVEEALKRVAEVSDNFAAIMLSSKLRQLREERQEENEAKPLSARSARENKLLVQMISDLGMKDTSFDSDPIDTTAYDIGLFLKLLYEGKVVSPSASEKIIELLSKSQLNNRIPVKLPEGLKIAHKTGELAGIRHDVGIVYLEGKPYVIVLMSKELKYEDSGIEAFANLSKDVYEYFKDKELR